MLINTLNHFGDCSGLRVSIAKSSLFTSGICSQDMDTIKEITGFTQGSFPFRYLGIPVADSRLSIDQYGPLIDKITGHISAWAGANLSYAGRIELIKSVLQGAECFWLSILPTPAGVQAKIIKLCKNFLWSGKCSENKKPLVAWRDITLPKSEGGLGIRNSKAWNKALLAKTMWDIQSKKDSLWVMGLRDEIIATEQSQPAAAQKINQWTANGDLHSKLAYDYFKPKANKLKWPAVIWSNYTTPKHAFILWLAMKERLLTKDRLPDPGADQTCSLCRTENETTEHLFFQCNFVRQIWSPIKSWMGFRRTLSTLKAAVKWSIKEARGTGIQSKAKRLGIACTTYFVWEARNLR
ncbi:Ribonuclease H protein [Actinidia chinensis var. chinensis]|uniref:Ribonuclease H protein n=1 Tax=Actinidia chinensis var. chinensis TaxID=1590841 RepID=A0A2R6RKT3_ACTCC|nr:Ribonuclease H protein [Actinidia chinensis var. chinensis]